MSLWGDTDAVPSVSTATVSLSGFTVTGSGTSFGLTGCAQTGDIIRFGAPSRGATGAGHTYYGDAVITGITSASICTIGSTAGLDAHAGMSTHFTISRYPKFLVKDSLYSHARTDADAVVYGISTTSSTTYSVTHQGWVGVTTYLDNAGNLRVKNEVMVAMSGINTAANVINNTPSLTFPTDAGRS